MPEPDGDRQLTLRDIAERLKALQRQTAALSEKLDDRTAELRERLAVLERLEEPERPPFPTTVEQWEEYLPELFGALLPPALVPVCARLITGERAKQIASGLGRPLTTVKSQVVTIRERLNLATSDEIALRVFQQFWDFYRPAGGRASWNQSKGR